MMDGVVLKAVNAEVCMNRARREIVGRIARIFILMISYLALGWLHWKFFYE